MHMLTSKPVLLIMGEYKYMLFVCVNSYDGPEYAYTIDISAQKASLLSEWPIPSSCRPRRQHHMLL